jgi:hypothetical protein
MKKTILTVATFLTLGLNSFAQECKSIKVEVDSYTGKKTIETDYIDFNGGTYLLSRESFGISLWIQLQSEIILTVQKGDFVYFKLSDNSVVKFYIQKSDISDYSRHSGYSNSFGFILEKEVLQSLMSKEIIGIKCSVNEYDLTKEQGTDLKNNINCIVNTK